MIQISNSKGEKEAGALLHSLHFQPDVKKNKKPCYVGFHCSTFKLDGDTVKTKQKTGVFCQNCLTVAFKLNLD